jgi:hypothetical protein
VLVGPSDEAAFDSAEVMAVHRGAFAGGVEDGGIDEFGKFRPRHRLGGVAGGRAPHAGVT